MPDTPSQPDPRDPHTLLCERCGYVIEGLPTTGPCPECGEPIEASLPERRTGSAWQRDHDLYAWRMTRRECMTRPRAAFRAVWIRPRSLRALVLINGLLLSIWTMFSIELLAWASTASPSHPTISQSVWRFLPEWLEYMPTWMSALNALVIGPTLVLLAVWIESVGIRFYGRHRCWRISRDVAHTVVAHASVGWVTGAWVVVCGHAFLFVSARTGFGLLVSTSTAERCTLLVLGLGVLVGLLTFETLVYLGIRQCRYANMPRQSKA